MILDSDKYKFFLELVREGSEAVKFTMKYPEEFNLNNKKDWDFFLCDIHEMTEDAFTEALEHFRRRP